MFLSDRMDVHALMIIMPAFDLIGIAHNGWKLGNELDGLPQNIFNGDIIRLLVIGIEGQHAARQLIHDIRRGRLHNHILNKIFRELAALGQGLRKGCELRLRGQRAEQEQPGNLFIAEAVLRFAAMHQIEQIYPAVNQAAGHRYALSVADIIALHVADTGEPCHNACAILVAQAALDGITLEVGRVDGVIFAKLLA